MMAEVDTIGLPSSLSSARGHRVVWHADADGLLLANEELGHVARGFEHEGIRAWHQALHDAVGEVVHVGVAGDLAEIRAHEAQGVVLFELPYLVDAFHRLFLVNVAAEPVDRAGRIDDHPATTEHIHRLVDPSSLWMSGVNFDAHRGAGPGNDGVA